MIYNLICKKSDNNNFIVGEKYEGYKDSSMFGMFIIHYGERLGEYYLGSLNNKDLQFDIIKLF